MKKIQKKAFTLIELLIVVAIIAILAAIAVPNFLEAQVRAKVSRCKADLRSFATAIEAYAVEWNNYPPLVAPTSPFAGSTAPGGSGINGASVFGVTGSGGGVSSRFIRLTTPVAYITSVFRDPFIGPQGWAYVVAGDNPTAPKTPGTASGYDGYDYVDARSFLPGGALRRTTATQEGAARCSGAAWHIVSAGPDLINAFGGGGGNTKRPNTGADYDPTNGTLSTGDVVRVGGGPGQLVRNLLPVYDRIQNKFNP